jgi:hypothetical protein
MEQIIGYTIKSHDNGFVGQVKSVSEPFRLGVGAKIKNGLHPYDQDYIAFAVEIEEKPSQWTTLIAKDGFGILKRYAV